MEAESKPERNFSADCGYKVSVYNLPKFVNWVFSRAGNDCIGAV